MIGAPCLPLGLKRTHSVLYAEGGAPGRPALDDPMSSSQTSTGDGCDADICMTPVAGNAPESPFACRRPSREDRFSLAPPSPPCKRVPRGLKHRVSWSDLFRQESMDSVTPRNGLLTPSGSMLS